MSDNSSPKNTTTWIMALIISVALNGLLAGLLMSGKVGHKPYMVEGQPSQPAPMMAGNDNPRRLLRHLDQARRKEIMVTAMKQTRKNEHMSHRELMKELRVARRQILVLLQSPELDEAAFQEQLAHSRQLKDKLGRQGDALVLEIFKQLTPAERKSLGKAGRKKKSNQKTKN